MLRSSIKQILNQTLLEYALHELGRPLKEYEITHFYNMHEEWIEHIINQTVFKLRNEVAKSIRDYKNENISI